MINVITSFFINFPYFVSRLIRYPITCSMYEHILKQRRLLTNKLIKEDYQQSRLKLLFPTFCGRNDDLDS